MMVTLVTARELADEQRLAALCGAALHAGVDRIQLREKDLDDRRLLSLALELVGCAAGAAERLLINGRPDVARACGARGVQLPEAGLPVAQVRRAFPELEVGASRHDLRGALDAEAAGAHFVTLGPIFPTPGKGGRALGVEALQRVTAALTIPVHAIGGIGPENAARVRAAGAAGVAAIRAFLSGPLEPRVTALRGDG